MDPDAQQRFPPLHVQLRGNKGTVCIRPLRTDDAERLGDFYESVPRKDFRFYAPHVLDREHAEANAAKADSPLEVVLVAETPQATIAGYAWYRWRQPDAPSSGFGICVRVTHQDSGLGRALMERLATVAREIGPPVMHLTVQLANPRAVNLYQKMGFRVVKEGERRASHGFASEPEYHMERATRPV